MMDRRGAAGQNGGMEISATADYAVRALLALAETAPARLTGEVLAARQNLPRKFLEAVLADLRRAGLVRSHRGAEGGYELGRPPSEISIADVLRAVQGPLADVRGLRPEDVHYEGVAEHLPVVWVALRTSLRQVLEETSLADVLTGDLPPHVRALADAPGAWLAR
jgi:Rrf2 family protein